MHRAGQIAVYLGITMITLGMLVGFTAMFMQRDGLAINWLGLVPLGFIVLLVGMVAAQLSRPQDKHQSGTDA